MFGAIIRPARETDLPDLVDVYNYYVTETVITFDIEPFTVETRLPWFNHYAETGRHRLLVATDNERVIGYATSSPFRPKAAYITSVESTVYLSPGYHRQGIGTALYTALFDALEHEDVHRVLAGITLPNEASVALHKRFGFTPIGTYTEVGRKFGRYHDVLWLEKGLD